MNCVTCKPFFPLIWNIDLLLESFLFIFPMTHESLLINITSKLNGMLAHNQLVDKPPTLIIDYLLILQRNTNISNFFQENFIR